VDEPARKILAEQRRIEGNGIPQKDVRLFLDLMLSRSIHEYSLMESRSEPVFFDRGVPDIAGYASAFDLDYPQGLNAIREYRYNPTVFFTPAWEAIYTTDEERTLSFEGTQLFEKGIRRCYEEGGYTLLEVPMLSVEERADFILSYIHQ